MDVWFLPYQISACFTSYQKAGQRNQSQGVKKVETVCLTAIQPGMNLTNPITAFGRLAKIETLYIEGHGKHGTDMAFENTTGWCPQQITGPKSEYIDAHRLARILKSYGFKGSNIRLHVCFSAEANSFGHHLTGAMGRYGVPFKSMQGRKGRALAYDGTGGNFYDCA